jgi:ornithine carbamoyltransferase
MSPGLLGKSVLSILDLGREEALATLRLAERVKFAPQEFHQALTGQVMVMIFEKPSLRTRVSFESGMVTLGGSVIYLAHDQVRMGDREPVEDVARNLERMVHVIVGRTFAHKTLEVLAETGSIPVINALSDREHPCQALADFQTIRENFREDRIALTYVGDGNNVCHSLMLLGTLLGYQVRIANPCGFEPDAELVEKARGFAQESGGSLALGHDPRELAEGSQILYTDVWTSMGQESEEGKRMTAFAGFQINSQLVGLASPEVRVMHCLPAHRGQEITDEVLESPAAVIFDQAENRLHSQKALLLEILAGQ